MKHRVGGGAGPVTPGKHHQWPPRTTADTSAIDTVAQAIPKQTMTTEHRRSTCPTLPKRARHKPDLNGCDTAQQVLVLIHVQAPNEKEACLHLFVLLYGSTEKTIEACQWHHHKSHENTHPKVTINQPRTSKNQSFFCVRVFTYHNPVPMASPEISADV